ncbi:hypothetical protein [Geobacter sulfurreducens]|uniref:hypothetical protein n=1 Tax=Geobacter sulfurreducens TaxID=35554 RepID=UPI0020B68B2B|nr:hypothetical protein [Geobacter sulfurreducens]UTG93165.1 hypothetical protein J8622_02200 [Geobacter sulfurreducens]
MVSQERMKVFVGEVWQVGSSEISVMVKGCRGHYTAYSETFPRVSCAASTIKRALGGFVDAAHDHLSAFIAALPLHERREICLWMQDDEAPNSIPESEANEEKASGSQQQQAMFPVLRETACPHTRCARGGRNRGHNRGEK